MIDRQAVVRSLSDAIANMDQAASQRLAAKALAAGIDARDILADGIMAGMRAASLQEASIITLSTMMTTGMDSMAAVVDLLAKRGIRDRFKVIIGGAPVSRAFADRIGADGYARSTPEAVRLVRSLVA